MVFIEFWKKKKQSDERDNPNFSTKFYQVINFMKQKIMKSISEMCRRIKRSKYHYITTVGRHLFCSVKVHRKIRSKKSFMVCIWTWIRRPLLLNLLKIIIFCLKDLTGKAKSQTLHWVPSYHFHIF